MPIAIDFGTSNTVIARWNAATNQPETVKLPGLAWQMGQNPPLIPSLLYLENAATGKVTVGQAVRDLGYDVKNDPRFFRGFKRGIGTKTSGFMPELDGETVTFEQVGEWFLSQVVAGIRQVPLPVDSLVLTVPVDSFEAYRQWLAKVCQKLEVNQVRMLDEPTAAALGYGMTEKELLLVIDFGGGTLDLSLVRLDMEAQKKPLGFILKWGEKMFAEKSGQRPQIARVLAKAGKNLGGTDIDNWLGDYFATQQGIRKSSLTARLAERVKIQLSMQDKASEVYFDEDNFQSCDLVLDRGGFEEILAQNRFFEQLDEAMNQVLRQGRMQGVDVGDIDGVLLVGGTVQIPAVQRWVRGYFAEEKIRSLMPFEAIARGALQVAQGIEVKDFLYHSYGIRYWDRRQQCHNWHPLIKAGQPYPTGKPVELVLGASLENQPSIEVIIGELGAETGGTEVYFDGDRLITRSVAAGNTSVQPLNDRAGARTIAKLNPPGNPGSDRIKIAFTVDESRRLCITVEDLFTDAILVENQPVVELS